VAPRRSPEVTYFCDNRGTFSWPLFSRPGVVLVSYIARTFSPLFCTRDGRVFDRGFSRRAGPMFCYLYEAEFLRVRCSGPYGQSAQVFDYFPSLFPGHRPPFA